MASSAALKLVFTAPNENHETTLALPTVGEGLSETKQMQRLISGRYFSRHSPASKLLKSVARPIPTSKALKLTPLQKIKRICGEPVTAEPMTWSSKVHNYFIEWFVGLGENNLLWSPAFKLVAGTAKPSICPSFTKAFLRQQQTQLTTYNHWRVFLYGKGAAHRGRERSDRKVIGALLRSVGAGSPKEAGLTLAWLVVMYLLWMLRKAMEEHEPREEEGGVDPNPPVEPRDPDAITVSHEPGHGGSGLAVSKLTLPSLRDLLVYVLRSLGMTREGIGRLLEGRYVYGPDFWILKDMVTVYYIECTRCGTHFPVSHERLHHFVIYLVDQFIVYCPRCRQYTEAVVREIPYKMILHKRHRIPRPLQD